MSCRGPSSYSTFALFKVWTSRKLPQSGANRVHNALLAFVFSEGWVLLEGLCFWSIALTQWPHETRFFRRVECGYQDRRAAVGGYFEKSVVNDELRFPWAHVRGLTTRETTATKRWGRAASIPQRLPRLAGCSSPLHLQNPSRRQARRLADHAADQIRAGHQFQGGEGARNSLSRPCCSAAPTW